MKRLYILRSTTLNITNLPQCGIYLSRTDLYDPCTPTIDRGQIGFTLAKFPFLFQPENTKEAFRNTRWEEQIEKLLALFNSIDQSIVFGVNSDEQMIFLKNYFGADAVTISCSYGESFYQTILTWFVKRHIAQQDCGILEMTAHDRDLRNIGDDLIEYYKRSFVEQKLVPRKLTAIGDYDIPVEDLFDPEKFFQHLTNLDSKPTDKAIGFYNDWYTYNKI